MMAGALKVSQCVSLTLGPGGRLVMLQGMPAGADQDPFSSLNAKELQVTKDGVTVAKALNSYSSNCRLTNIGAKLIIDASERANEECGDGTTTATLIGGFLIQEG